MQIGCFMTDTHYLALYRKYRPRTFEDVCGRDTIVRTIRNQINTGHIGHSYLFCGTRGTGKTTIAKIFAKAVNCENPQDGNPCCSCPSCQAIDQEANLNVVEMDAASNNGVDDIRGIIEQVSYSPTQGKYRVFIIDEVHMLSTAAFNALLKTLEEPPSYAIFILATTEPNRLPVTILSRCQRYDFGRLSVSDIGERLRKVAEKEGLEVEDKAIRYIASAADGSMRDGLSILDQCNAFNLGSTVLTYEKTLEILGAVDTRVFSRLFGCIHDADVTGALNVLDEIVRQGRELTQFVADFLGYLRNVMLLKASEEIADSLDVSADNLELLLADARRSEMSEDIRYIDIFSGLSEQIRYSANRRILTETALIRLCHPSMDIPGNAVDKIEKLMVRVNSLENELDRLMQLASVGGSFPQGASGALPKKEASGPDSAPEEAKAAPVLPAALPEDIRKIAASWNALLGAIPEEHHMIKIYLMGAAPSVSEKGELLIVFENYVYAVHFIGKQADAQENREFLAAYLARRIGRAVPIEYKQLDNGEKFTDNYVDIRKAVNMEIEQE